MLVGTREIGLPGVYMDAVNPDYLVARILGPAAHGFPAWVAPGNDLLHRFPVLVGLHHGSGQFWLGLPLFAIFGMSVTALRIVHMCFALAVLAACYAALLRGGVTRWVATGAAVALALDPAFIFAFRTQSYITMAPFALVMLAVVAITRARGSDPPMRWKWVTAAGVATGFAVWGYFIYAFFVPALFVAVALAAPRERRWHELASFTAGLAAGAALYAVGYTLLAVELGGLTATWTHVTSIQPGLGIVATPVPAAERVKHLIEMVDMVLTNAWHRALVFREDTRSMAEQVKVLALVATPLPAWIVLEWLRSATWMLRVSIGLLVSYLAIALLFGTRLSGHHFMPLLPLLYVTLAVIGQATLARCPGRISRWSILVGLIVLATFNTASTLRDFATLRVSGGVGTFSDAINRFGADLASGPGDALLVLPDWGLFMPIVFLTQAGYETEFTVDVATMRRSLCNGRDVVVALIDGDRAARFKALQEALAWTAPAVTAYRQRDGGIVFEVGRFHGSRDAPACT